MLSRAKKRNVVKVGYWWWEFNGMLIDRCSDGQRADTESSEWNKEVARETTAAAAGVSDWQVSAAAGVSVSDWRVSTVSSTLTLYTWHVCTIFHSSVDIFTLSIAIVLKFSSAVNTSLSIQHVQSSDNKLFLSAVNVILAFYSVIVMMMYWCYLGDKLLQQFSGLPTPDISDLGHLGPKTLQSQKMCMRHLGRTQC